MDKLEITSSETAILLGSSQQMIIQNIGSELIYWSVDSNSSEKFRLRPMDSILVNYNVYLTSKAYGDDYVVLGRL